MLVSRRRNFEGADDSFNCPRLDRRVKLGRVAERRSIQSESGFTTGLSGS
jgi:hypothetical protein